MTAISIHLVLSTIHASSVPLVIKRMLNLDVSDTDLEDVLIGIVSQRIKYDKRNKRVIVLPEMMNKAQIKALLHHQDISYPTFEDHARYLIAHGVSPRLFVDELEEASL